MNSINQISMYKNRKKIKNEIRPLRLEKRHYKFVELFIKKNKKPFNLFLFFVVLQSIFEIFLIFLINNSISIRIYNAVLDEKIFYMMVVFIGGSVLYLIVTFFSLKFEREVIVEFINELRRSLFSNLLNKKNNTVDNISKSNFIAKISYHLPLVSLGVDRSVFGLVRWLLSSFIILSMGIILGGVWVWLSVAIILLSIFIGFIGYVIARYYVSQEVASYSLVIKQVFLSLVELFSIKKNKTEQSSINDLNEKVEIDSYFRVRRDILLRYFGRVVMVMVFMFSVVYLFSAFYFSNINLFSYDPSKTVLIGIIFLYAIRIFYESSLVGLYIIPTKLGLVLSVPQNESFYKKEVDKEINWNKISFKTNKVKLVEEGEYYKNLSISVEKNNNYLFLGDSMSGKTSLANVFDLYPDLNENAWIVKKDNKRFSLRRWSEIFDDKYLIANNLPTEKKIGEIIFKKDSSEINERDIKKLNKIIEKYDFLKPYFVKKRFVGDSVRVYKNNESIIFFIQALYCLVNNVSFIIIDNKWVDLNYEEINKTIKMLDEEIDSKTIVVFSRRKNNILYYNNIYEIQKNKIVPKEK